MSKLQPDNIQAHRGDGHEAPSLDKKLLAIDSYWDMEPVFFKDVVSSRITTL